MNLPREECNHFCRSYRLPERSWWNEKEEWTDVLTEIFNDIKVEFEH